MFKYDGSARWRAFEALQSLLNQAQVELGARAWEGTLSERLDRAGELRTAIFEAAAAYARAREEEQASWMAL